MPADAEVFNSPGPIALKRTREILKNGRYGHLVPVGDVTALARAIEIRLGNHSPRPPQESWLPFEVDTVVQQYLDVLLGDESCV